MDEILAKIETFKEELRTVPLTTDARNQLYEKIETLKEKIMADAGEPSTDE